MSTRFRYDVTTEGREETVFGPSKTQVKDEMLDLQELGLALLELPAERLARIDMDERLRDAFAELQRISSHGARRRQAQYIGKLLRDADVEPFHAALAAWQKGKQQAALGFPDIARWRDRLLADDGMLTEWCACYPTSDTRKLRALIRNTRKEEAAAVVAAESSGKPAVKGRHFRELFQYLRATAEAAELGG